MFCRVALVTLVSLVPSIAHAAFYLYGPDGSVTYVPDEIMVLLAVLVLAVCVGLICACIEGISSSSSAARMGLDLPEEVREPESVEHYEDMTARTRALKRKLDADTELAESYIKAARARTALDDLENVRSESTARRRANTDSR